MAEQTSTFIGRLRQELEAATPGPWECWVDNPSLPGLWAVGRPEEVEGENGDSSAFVAGEVWEEADATLIANAPTCLAALLDVAEAAQRFSEARAAGGEAMDRWNLADSDDRREARAEFEAALEIGEQAADALDAALQKLPQVGGRE
jgi:hypothetical protein